MKNDIFVPLNEFEKAHYNPRVITPENFQRLKDSIKNHTKNMIDWDESEGLRLVEPIIVNKFNNRLIAGHQRTRALSELNQDWIHVDDIRFINVEDELEEKGLNVKLNSEDLKGDFEEDLLRDIIYEFQGIDYSIDEISDSIGINNDYINEILDVVVEPEDKDDDVPDLDGKNIISKVGDIYEIGVHRVMCGDSRIEEDVESLMGGDKCDIVFTDPPYGVSIGDKNKLLDTIQKAGKIIENIEQDTLEPEELKKSLVKSFKNLKKHSNDVCSYFVTAPQGGELGMMMMMMMKESGIPVRHIIIWVKNRQSFSYGRLDYEYKHEPILYTWNKTHKFYARGNQKSSVWNIDRRNKCDIHPTMKPVELIVNAIYNNSKVDDIICDYFLGSGTTVIAADKTSRICYGMEISPHYCDVIVQRYINYTGTTDNCFLIRDNEKIPLKDIWSKQ